MTAVLDSGATTATPDFERSDETRAVNATHASDPTLAAMLAGATKTSPQVARKAIATAPAEAAPVPVRAICPMLRPTPPEVKTTALPTSAGVTRHHSRPP